jgi:hypothetical protein
MAELQPDLLFAGVPVEATTIAEGEQYWEVFAQSVERTLATLNTWWG